MLASVFDFAEEVLGGEAPLAELLGQGVRRRRIDTPRSTSWDSILEISVVLPGSSSSNSSIHTTVYSPSRSMHSTNPNTPASWVSSPNVAKAGGVQRNRAAANRMDASRWVLPTPNPAVEVQPHPGQLFALAEQLAPARPAAHRLVAEAQAGPHGRGLAGLGGSGR